MLMMLELHCVSRQKAFAEIALKRTGRRIGGAGVQVQFISKLHGTNRIQRRDLCALHSHG